MLHNFLDSTFMLSVVRMSVGLGRSWCLLDFIFFVLFFIFFFASCEYHGPDNGLSYFLNHGFVHLMGVFVCFFLYSRIFVS